MHTANLLANSKHNTSELHSVHRHIASLLAAQLSTTQVTEPALFNEIPTGFRPLCWYITTSSSESTSALAFGYSMKSLVVIFRSISLQIAKEQLASFCVLQFNIQYAEWIRDEE